MMKHLIAAVALLLLVFPVIAQDEPAWDVVVIEPVTGVLYNITPEGIKAGANLSDMLQFEGTDRYLLTPDRGSLVFIGYSPAADEDSTLTSGIYVADVSTGACCRRLIDPLNSIMDGVIIGKLSPDGTQVVALLFHIASLYGSESSVESLVTTFDIASGSVTGNLGVSSLAQLTEDFVDSGVVFGDWREDGVRLAPSCLGCEPALTGIFQIWNPAAGDLSEPVEPYDLSAQTLPATGERIITAQNTDFAYDPELLSLMSPSNVIEYYPDSGTTPQVIFFNPINLHISQAHWILDGQAVLVQYYDAQNQVEPSTEAYVVYRDGSWFPLDMPLNQTFLSGTPDGWLMTDTAARTFVNYTVAGFKQVDAVVVDAYGSDVVMLVQPAPMGLAITEKRFALFGQ